MKQKLVTKGIVSESTCVFHIATRSRLQRKKSMDRSLWFMDFLCFIRLFYVDFSADLYVNLSMLTKYQRSRSAIKNYDIWTCFERLLVCVLCICSLDFKDFKSDFLGHRRRRQNILVSDPETPCLLLPPSSFKFPLCFLAARAQCSSFFGSRNFRGGKPNGFYRQFIFYILTIYIYFSRDTAQISDMDVFNVAIWPCPVDRQKNA